MARAFTAGAKFGSFAEFYPYYLSQHQHRVCRRLHFTGSVVVIAALWVAIVTREPWWLLVAPLGGYGFAWIGHFFFERNRPATFRYPWYSLAGDWVMARDLLLGKLTF